jgi:predicted peptidase
MRTWPSGVLALVVAGVGVLGCGCGGGSGGSASAPFPWEGAVLPGAGPSSTRLAPRELGQSTAPQGYYEYLPAGYPGGVKWPLLVALHGIGENGDGGSQLGNVTHTGIGRLLSQDAWPGDRPFVVLLPQHPGGGCPGAEEIRSFIAWSLENYDVDRRYVYLTGLSCGAIGAWSYLAQNLDAQVAAVVPIAGDGSGAWRSKGCDLARVAIWAFHGDADGTVGVSGTNTPMDGLAGCPAPPARETRKTIYPGVGHDSWSRTYDLSAGNDIYTWMLRFTKGGS